MNEPAIVSYGHQFFGNYSVKEYRDSLVRAFVDKRADFILLDDNPRGQKFLAAVVAWAMDEGLLYNDRNEDDNDTRQVVSYFRLTAKGEKEIMGQP